MLVHSCPVFGYDETSPISRSSAVQLLSPHNEHSIVFDLPYDEHKPPRSVGEASP